jgi:hypothetical protein
MRRVCSAIAILALTSASLSAQEAQPGDAASASRSLTLGLGRFEGEYGLPEKTTFDVATFNARWYLPRAQILVSAPYLRVEGPAAVQLIGGQPVVVPGEGGEERRKESGLGDSVVQGEYYLRTGSSTSPWVIGRLRLKLPTGDEDKGLGTGSTDLEIGLGLVRQHGNLTWLGDIGYAIAGSSSSIDLNNVLRVGAGVSRSLGERTSGYLYLENRTKAVATSDDRRSFILGAERSLDAAQQLRLAVSMFVGLTEATGDLGLFLNLSRRY